MDAKQQRVLKSYSLLFSLNQQPHRHQQSLKHQQETQKGPSNVRINGNYGRPSGITTIRLFLDKMLSYCDKIVAHAIIQSSAIMNQKKNLHCFQSSQKHPQTPVAVSYAFCTSSPLECSTDYKLSFSFMLDFPSLNATPPNHTFSSKSKILILTQFPSMFLYILVHLTRG